jgi:choline dehydrogenase-like flavoprotein
MIIDFRSSDAPQTYETDVCIVGSGAAGLTLAAELAGRLRILLIEAGDRRPPTGDDDWLRGEATGAPFDGFQNGRRRSFGGATKGWAGQCIRLDPIVFEKRDWVPYSGWPFPAATLDPFYDRAEQMLGLHVPYYDARLWERFGRPDPGFDPADVTPRFTVYCRQPDLARAFGWALLRDKPNIDLVLNAAAVHIDLHSAGAGVTGLHVRAAGDRRGHVRARAFVLCGGGIENARLLLVSDKAQPNGIGNANDLVGRFFQDHPSGTTGHIATDNPARLQAQFRKFRGAGLTFWPKLALTDAAQRAGRYLNANALMLFDYAETSALQRAKAVIAAARARQAAGFAREAARVLRHLPELTARGLHTLATGLAPVFPPSRVLLKAHVEQVPDPQNRITLSAERDGFGVRRPRLTWRVHPDELRSLRAVTEAAGAVLQRLGFGTMSVADWLDQDISQTQPHIEDTYHHAGATRMAATPEFGVVVPDARVFGVDNLYIAGGSVFPTSGYANPTLTIMALAIRLADTLRARYPAQ